MKSLSESELATWKKKRTITLLIFLFQTFLLGANYSTATTTLWPYLLQFNTPYPNIFFGLSFGCQVLMGSTMSLILSRLADRTRRVRLTMLFVNSVVVLGNVCYTVGLSPYLLVFGRALAGSSMALNPVISGEVSRCYGSELLTGIFAMLTFTNGLGLMIGPALSVVFQNVNFWMGWLHIIVLNAGSFSIAVGFTLIQGAVLVCVSDLSKEYDLKESLQSESQRLYDCDGSLSESEDLSHAKENIDKKKEQQEPENSKNDTNSSLQTENFLQVLQTCYRSQTMVTMFMAAFLFGFSILSFELIPSLVGSKVLKWTSRQIGWAYVFSGSYYLIICLIIVKFRKHVLTVKLFLAAFIFNGAGCTCVIILSFQIRNSPTTLFFWGWLILVHPTLYITEMITLRAITAQLVTSAHQSLVQAFIHTILLTGFSLGGLMSSINSEHLEIFGSVIMLVTIIDFVFVWKVRETLYNPKPIV